MTWHDLPEVFRYVFRYGNIYLFVSTHIYILLIHGKSFLIFITPRTNPLFICDKETLHHHDSTYTSIGGVKDVDPEVLQGVLNFIDTNTQAPDPIDVPEDVKEELAMTSTSTCYVKDEFGTLQALKKVLFGIWEQCKLITDLSYQMDDVACGETVLSHLTDLYMQMYDACRKDSLVVPLRKDHLKFTVLGGQRKKKGFYRGRRIVPLFPTKTAKAHQVRHSRFRRKANSCVTDTTMKEMLTPTRNDDNDNENETPMEVSDDGGDVVPFVDLDAYRGQDEIREKVLKTPGLLGWQRNFCPVKTIFVFCCHNLYYCHILVFLI